MHSFYLCCTAIALAAPSLSAKQLPATRTDDTPHHLSYRLIGSEGHTWGYDIYTDEKKMIHQPSIPGAAGNKGFQSKKMAVKVARLVIFKISHNEMPPTVTPEELQKLNCK